MKLWEIPSENGLDKDLSKDDAVCVLEGHQRDCQGFRWHTSAENIVASMSSDNSVRAWDVNTQKTIFSSLMNKKKPTSIQWNPKGDLLAVNNQGGNMSVFDIRTDGEVMHQCTTHEGGKAQKSIFVRDNIVLTSGFNKKPENEYAVWDLRQINEPVARGKLSNGQAVITYSMNREHDIIYASGKGAMEMGIWRYDESRPEMLKFFDNSTYTQPTIGFSLMPGWCNDVRKHEIDRGLRVLNNHTISIIGFSLKNRTDTYQPELYTPFASDKPSNNATEWAAGTDKDKNLQEFSEEDWHACEASGGIKTIKIVTSAELKVENAALKEELKVANEKIASLE